MVTITLTGQLQTADGERDLACEIPASLTVRQVIQRQGFQLRHLLQLLPAQLQLASDCGAQGL